jgi:hypothetical protein
MDQNKMINYFIEKIERKEMEIDGIRKEMEKNNLPEEDIRAVVRAVDSELRNHISYQSHQNRGRQLKILGVIIASIGILLTVGTYTSVLPSGNSFFILYGPVIAGIGIYYKGRMMQR